MATLQVKNVPDELHEAVRARADAEGMTISAFLLRTIAQAVERPALTTWLDDVLDWHGEEASRSYDIAAVMDEVRDER